MEAVPKLKVAVGVEGVALPADEDGAGPAVPVQAANPKAMTTAAHWIARRRIFLLATLVPSSRSEVFLVGLGQTAFQSS